MTPAQPHRCSKCGRVQAEDEPVLICCNTMTGFRGVEINPDAARRVTISGNRITGKWA